MNETPLNEFLDDVRTAITRDGFTVQSLAGHPPVSFTVGLGALLKDAVAAPDKPLELVVVGLAPALARTALERAASLLRGGFAVGEGVTAPDFFSRYAVRFTRVPAETVREQFKLYGALGQDAQSFDCWQMLWPDPSGHFPGEPAADVRYSAMQNFALVATQPAVLH